MKEVLNILLEFVIAYVLVFALYFLLFVWKKTRYNKNRVPVEYYYTISLYGLDQKKIDYKKFIYTSAFINSFIIVFTYMIVSKLLHKWIIQLLIGVVIVLLLIVICYGVLGRIYVKKGMRKNV